MKRINSGVPGLDEILKGGMLENSANLIAGPPGTGKSIFALQFLLAGADKNEPVLYISSEETEKDLREHAEELGFDLSKYKNTFNVFYVNLARAELFSLKDPIALIKKKKIKRIVLDSLTLFKLVYARSEFEFRNGILDFIVSMKELGVTLVATSEKSLNDLDEIIYEPQDFLFGGLILLTKIRHGNSFERVILISKMRGIDNLLEAFPFTIRKGGMTIFTKQLPFSLMQNAQNKN